MALDDVVPAVVNPKRHDVVGVGRLHPTQKPVELLGRILAVSDMCATVYDPFAGSGSTLVACHTQGRTARLMELDPRFVDVIVSRWQDLTGERANLVEST